MKLSYKEIAVYDEWKKQARPLNDYEKSIARSYSPYVRPIIFKKKYKGFELQYRKGTDDRGIYVYKKKDYHDHPVFEKFISGKK